MPSSRAPQYFTSVGYQLQHQTCTPFPLQHTTPHHTAAPLAHYGEIQTEEGVVSASRHLKDAIMQIFTQTACQNSVCSGFWKLCKIGIMRSPRFAFSRSMKILQKTWPNALSVRLRSPNIDSERVAAQTSKQATVSHTPTFPDITLLCGLTRARMNHRAGKDMRSGDAEMTV